MILSFISDFSSDLSIMQAKPRSLELLILIISAHSRTDLPVVMTSSRIKTFDFSGISKPLRRTNFPFDLSAKIVFTPSCLPIS